MKRLLLTSVALFAASAAHSQSIPHMDRRVTINGPTGLDWALSTKADANGGVLTNPALSGGKIMASETSGAVATPSGAITARSLSSHFSDVINVLDFGAKCDGTTDDTAAFNSALAAAAATVSHSVSIGGRSCKIDGVVNLPRSVWLHGSGGSGGTLLFGENSQIHFTAGNAFSWQGATLSDLYILVSNVDASQAFPIDMASAQPVYSQVRNVQIEGGTYYGIDMSGNNVTVDNVMMQSVKGVGIRIGHGSTGGNNTDPKVINTTVSGDSAAGSTNKSSAVLMLVEDAGGLTLQNNDMVGGLIGTQFIPGKNQTIYHLFASNTVLSDSAQQYGFEIDTSDPTAVAEDMKLEGSWTANAQQVDVAVNNSRGGAVDGIMFIGHRFYLANGDAFHAGSGVNNVTITASQFCGNNPNGSGIYVEKNDNGFNITNNRMPAICAGEGTGNSGTAISLAGNNNNMVVTGNDMNGASYGINFSGGAGLTDYIEDNIGANSVSRAVPTASVTTLPTEVVDYVTLSSVNGDTVLDLEGGWSGRKVYLYNSTTSPIAFGTGKNICNAYTLTAGGTVEAVYTAQGCWFLH